MTGILLDGRERSLGHFEGYHIVDLASSMMDPVEMCLQAGKTLESFRMRIWQSFCG